MGQMLTVPYARQRAVDNSDYIRMMSELMLNRGDAQARARLARGAANQQAWNRVGDITMATFAGIGKQRDEERNIAVLQAERDRQYRLQQEELDDRAEERRLAREYQQRQETRQGKLDKNVAAKEFTENLQVGAVVPTGVYGENVQDTSSASAYTPQAYEAARLPATAMADVAGYASSPTPALPGGGEGQSEYLLRSTRHTISPDVAERPEGMRRVASQQELVQLETLRRQAEAAWQLAQDRRDDNAARDQAARALAEYRKEQLRLGQARVDASRDSGGGVPVIQEAGGQLWKIPKDGGPAVPVVTADGQPLKKFADTSGLGDYQNVVAFALGKMPAGKQPAVIESASRMLREGDKEGLLSYLKKTVLDNVSGSERTKVTGRVSAIAAMNNAKVILQQLEAAGVNTSLLTGAVEDLHRAVGKTRNPKLVELESTLMSYLRDYRQAMTGLAFSDAESRDYTRQWPSYRDEMPVNLAKVDGLLRAMAVSDQSFWEMNLGPSAAKLFGTASPAPVAPTKPVVPRGADGKLVIPR